MGRYTITAFESTAGALAIYLRRATQRGVRRCPRFLPAPNSSNLLLHHRRSRSDTQRVNGNARAYCRAPPLAIVGFPAVIDAKGRFLFAAGNDSIHMYQVDATTGNYTEVTGSPFFSGNTNGPVLLATEPTGAYLAVVNSTGLNPGESSVEILNQRHRGNSHSCGGIVPGIGFYAGRRGGQCHAWEIFPCTSALIRFRQIVSISWMANCLSTPLILSPGCGQSEPGGDGLTNRGRSFGASAGPLRSHGTGPTERHPAGHFRRGRCRATERRGRGIPLDILVAPGQRFVYATLFSARNSVVSFTSWYRELDANGSPVPRCLDSRRWRTLSPTPPASLCTKAPRPTRCRCIR